MLRSSYLPERSPCNKKPWFRGQARKQNKMLLGIPVTCQSGLAKGSATSCTSNSPAWVHKSWALIHNANHRGPSYRSLTPNLDIPSVYNHGTRRPYLEAYKQKHTRVAGPKLGADTSNLRSEACARSSRVQEAVQDGAVRDHLQKKFPKLGT